MAAIDLDQVLGGEVRRCLAARTSSRGRAVLAEKFCLLLETLLDQRVEYRVVSASPHVPIVQTARVQQIKTSLSR